MLKIVNKEHNLKSFHNITGFSGYKSKGDADLKSKNRIAVFNKEKINF